MIFKFVFLCIFLLPTLAFSGSPTCQDHSSGPYCSYTGKVSSIYVNSTNMILLYFDAPVDVASANSFGINITNPTAAALPVSENPEFAKMFYSTALAAQASDRSITIQMRKNYGGYLQADRIWLYAP